MTAYQMLGTMTKDAATRREFIAMLLRNTAGGAAIGSAYKAGLRPLVKNLHHEVGTPSVIRGSVMGPLSGPSVGPDDIKAWEGARKQMGDRLNVNWGSDAPTKSIENAQNLAGFKALSPAGQKSSLSRFFKREAASGAASGGAVGGVGTVLMDLIKRLKQNTKS